MKPLNIKDKLWILFFQYQIKKNKCLQSITIHINTEQIKNQLPTSRVLYLHLKACIGKYSWEILTSPTVESCDTGFCFLFFCCKIFGGILSPDAGWTTSAPWAVWFIRVVVVDEAVDFDQETVVAWAAGADRGRCCFVVLLCGAIGNSRRLLFRWEAWNWFGSLWMFWIPGIFCR